MAFKIVVLGYSEMFAAVIQACLASGNKIVGVMRHERVLDNPVKLFFKDIFIPSKDYSYIKSFNLPEIKARSANSQEFRDEILKLNPDMIIVASWGEKLKKETIMLPKIACINCHPSLLPRYRGPNPYMQVIKHSEKETGVTFHIMDEGYDTGPILMQKNVPILPGDTGKVLRSRCAQTAKEALIELLLEMQSDILIPIPQKESIASYYPQITADDVLISFKNTSTNIDAQIRSIISWQKCYFRHKREFFIINKFKIVDNTTKHEKPGTIVKKSGSSISVLCKDNKIIEFTSLKLYKGIKSLFTGLYIKFCVKVGSVI